MPKATHPLKQDHFAVRTLPVYLRQAIENHNEKCDRLNDRWAETCAIACLASADQPMLDKALVVRDLQACKADAAELLLDKVCVATAVKRVLENSHHSEYLALLNNDVGASLHELLDALPWNLAAGWEDEGLHRDHRDE